VHRTACQGLGYGFYDNEKKWLKRGNPDLIPRVIFKCWSKHAGTVVEPRPIVGVRRLMEIKTMSVMGNHGNQLALISPNLD